MTQDEIIEMAKLAGWEMDDSCVLSPQVLWYIYQEQLETFAKLVAAKEREACAKLCDWMQEKAEFHGTDCCKFPTPTDCAYAIRARGEA